MKALNIFHLAIGLFLSTFLFSGLAAPPPALAQESGPESGVEEAAPVFSREELTQMLAPIALYPDPLLSQVLMASTYPIEVVEADRWRKNVKHLEGNALDAALLDMDWDPSVKTMCHFPDVLAIMSQNIGETTNIGNAFLAQEADVMDVVQELRAKALAQGTLKTTEQQKVVVEKETVIIQPADPRVVYVPYYDPFYVYGSWWYPAYPPYYWGPPGVTLGIGISFWPGIYFGFTFGDWWYFDWHRHYIYIDVHKRPRYVRHDRWYTKAGPWRHAPHHRRGVAYRDKFTARKYGQHPARVRHYDRDVRGFPERREPDRTRIERERQRPGTAVERDRTRVERERQVQEKADRERAERERTRMERNRQDRERMERQRTEQEKQMRDRAERDRRERERIDRDRQTRERADKEKQTRERIDRDRQMRQRTEQERQMRERVEQQRRQQERVDRNIFNWVDQGRRERESSERGRMSRGGRGGEEMRGRSRGGDDGGGRSRGDGGGRDDRGRRGR